MAHWRFGSDWTDAQLRVLLAELPTCPPNFDTPVEQMTRENGWHVDPFQAVVGTEPPGPPLADGLFVHAREGLINYDFSDPRLVQAHFDPRAPLVGRNMLVEMKALGLRVVTGVRVRSAWDETDGPQTRFAFEYCTLEGHLERGVERFTLTKDHHTGLIRFRIQDHWRVADIPEWWLRIGFLVCGGVARKLWPRLAVLRLRRMGSRRADRPAPGFPGAAFDRPARDQR